MRSLFDRLGGEGAVAAAVDRFYDRILADDRVREFFSDVDMERQKAKQRSFLIFAFGGPRRYTGQSMRRAHAHLLERGLSDEHVDVVLEHLRATLEELGAAPQDVDEAVAIAESQRDAVLSRA